MIEEVFKNREGIPGYWFNKSRDLLCSAKILYDARETNKGPNYWNVYSFLMGLSFELLFKAILIKEDICLLRTHNIRELAKHANILLTDDEADIFDILTEYVIWEGKYPTPTSANKLEQHWNKQNDVLYDVDETGIFSTYNNKLDFNYLLEIWRKFFDEYFYR